MRYKKFSFAMLIVSIIAGLLYGLIMEFPYRLLYNLNIGDFRFPSVVLTLIYFLGLFITVGIAVALVSNIRYNQYNGTIHKKLFFISLILIILLSLLFEFLYDIVRKNVHLGTFDSYVFVIDESGSMTSSDPQEMRYDVIDKLLENKKDTFEYAIYAFSNDWIEVRKMAPKSDNIKWADVNGIKGGGTEIYRVLDGIYELIDNGELDADKKTRIILLSDGDPTEYYSKKEVQNMLAKYENKGITISSVGLLYDLQWYMEMIAESTGGVYVKCTNPSKLDSAMTTASIGTNFYRNLLGPRSSTFLPILLGLMRIIFVTGLGLIIALEKCAIAEKFVETKSVLISSVVGGILAGITIEIGYFLLPIFFQFLPGGTILQTMTPTLMRVITCVLIAFTVLREDALINDANMSVHKDYFY